MARDLTGRLGRDDGTAIELAAEKDVSSSGPETPVINISPCR